MVDVSIYMFNLSRLGSFISHRSQSNPRMEWLMFQYICLIYHDINNKEVRDSVTLITSMSNNIQTKKYNLKVKTHGGTAETNQPLQQMISIHTYII